MRKLFGLVDSDFEVFKPELNKGSFGTVLEIVFGVAAAVAILMIIIGGLKYVISRGEPAEVAKAKNTIIYSVVGLAIAATAYSIVSFVVKKV